MTRRSILEYVQALRSRYLGASKEGKGKMLEEFTRVIGCHCKQPFVYSIEEISLEGAKSVVVLGNMVPLWLMQVGSR